MKSALSEKKSQWILFLLWPLLSLVFAVRNYNFRISRNILWAFTVFYGFTFVISDEKMDANRYRDALLENAAANMSLDQFFSTLYNKETLNADILEPLLTYLVSTVSTNYNVLFAVFGFVFGFFYSRNLWYLFEKLHGRIKPAVVLLVATFAVVIPIWSINGFRFSAASHVFLFGLLPYLLDGKKKWLWVSFLSLFVHFAFLFPVCVLIIYLIFRNRLNIYFIFFIASIFVTEINVTRINEFIALNLPEVFFEKAKRYSNEERIEALNERAASSSKNWYALLYGKALRWTVIAYLIIIFTRGKRYLASNKGWLRLFCFSVLLFGFSNILSLVPSGGRFIAVSCMFGLAVIAMCIQNVAREQQLSRLVPIAVPPLLLFVVVSLRVSLDTVGLFTIFGNPIFVFFKGNDFALIELIK